jgi:hypothetical protein
MFFPCLQNRVSVHFGFFLSKCPFLSSLKLPCWQHFLPFLFKTTHCLASQVSLFLSNERVVPSLVPPLEFLIPPSPTTFHIFNITFSLIFSFLFLSANILGLVCLKNRMKVLPHNFLLLSSLFLSVSFLCQISCPTLSPLALPACLHTIEVTLPRAAATSFLLFSGFTKPLPTALNGTATCSCCKHPASLALLYPVPSHP